MGECAADGTGAVARVVLGAAARVDRARRSGVRIEEPAEQRDVELPSFWYQQATNIVVSKYFRGQIGSPDRERSVKQLIGRVVDTITGWGRKDGYFSTDADLQAFSDELKRSIPPVAS